MEFTFFEKRVALADWDLIRMRMSLFLDDRYGNIKNMFFETFFKDFRTEKPRSPFKKTAAELVAWLVAETVGLRVIITDDKKVARSVVRQV